MKISVKNMALGLAVILLLSCFWLFTSCPRENTKDLKDNPKIIKSDSIINAQKKEIEKLELEKAESKKQLDLSLFKSHQLELANSDLSKKYKSIREKVKNFDRGEIADFYVNRYNLPNDVKTTATGTDLSDAVAQINITELIDLDYCNERAKNLDSIIIQKNISISSTTDLWKKSEAQSKSYFSMYTEAENKFNVASEELKKEQEANSKEVVFRFLFGGGIGADKSLSQIVYKANVGGQTRNGNMYCGSFQRIGPVDCIMAETYISLFKIKGKKKN